MPSAEATSRRLGQRLRDRVDVAVLIAVVGAIQLFPRDMPGGIYGLGIVAGSTLALYAMGVVLIYRHNRIINFAQVQIGFLAATFFAVMVEYRPLLELIDRVCPPCLDQPSPGLITVNYWLSLTLAVALAVAVAYVIAALVVPRFARASRLLLTIATIFLAQLLAGIQGLLPTLLTTEQQRLDPVQLDAVPPPIDWMIRWEPAQFDTSQILTVVVGAVALIALVAHFRLTDSGATLRATAADPRRAQTLGINTRASTRRVWMLSGGLSGAAGVLAAMLSGAPVEATIGVSQMVTLLAAAIVAGMASLPIAAAAAIVFQVLVQALSWSFDSEALTGVVVLGVIALVLGVQRRTAWAAPGEAAQAHAAPEARVVPAELRALPIVRRVTLVAVGLVAVGLAAYPWAMSSAQTSVATRMMIFAVVGLSLLVLTGWAGHISLDQFGLAGVGGYVAAAAPLPFGLAVLAGGLAGAMVAAVLGVPALRLRGLQLAVISLAFAVAAPLMLLMTVGRWVPDRVERPAMLGLDFADSRVFYYLVLAVLVAAVAAVAGLRRTRTGRVLIAGRDNDAAAESFGVSLVRTRLLAFAASGFLAAVAGSLYAYQQQIVRPDTFLAEQSVTVFVIAVLGGLGSVVGPLLGATYFGVLQLLGANPVVAFIAAGGGGLAVMLVLPGGLSQLLFGVRDAWLRTLANRRGIVVESLQGIRPRDTARVRAPIAPNRRSDGGPATLRYRLDGPTPTVTPAGDGASREPAGD
jgi:branched-chain amino acid transport system permease protein